MKIRTHYVTPSLLVGEPPPGLTDWVRTTRLSDSLAAIRSGKRVVVPADAWDAVENILLGLELSPADIAEHLRLVWTAGSSDGC